jgi:hypothetical protein
MIFPKNLPGRRSKTSVCTVGVLIVQLVFVAGTFPLQAFDPGIHETVSEDVLRDRGFDADSADEVGDSNYYTDTFEPSNAAAHADANQLGAASARLRAKRTTIGDSLNSCKRRDALDALGEALHTVQDTYSHSNAVDNGIAIPDLLGMVNGTAACSPPNFAPGGLVTGYFSVSGYLRGLIPPRNPRGQCSSTPANACCHYDLNKDNTGAQNGTRHGAALAAAATATGTYLDLVEQDIRNRFSAAQATQMIKILKKKQRTVMFVIDDTGSMSTDIAGVRSTVNGLINSFIAGDEAPTLGLVSFKDNVNNRGLICDVETLRGQVNGLFASGGDDCPEAMNSALLSAIFTFPTGRSDIQLQGGQIFSATDASSGDANLGPQVQAEASRRGITLDQILTGDCTSDFSEEGEEAGEQSQDAAFELSPPTVVTMDAPQLAVRSHTGDPLTSPSARVQLAALSEQTGGVLFNVARSEVDDVGPALLEIRNLDTAVLVTRRLALAPGVPLTLDIPVDDTIEQVTFLATSSTAATRPTLTVTRPNGSPANTTDPDVTARTLSTVVSLAVRTPAVGSWRVVMSGSGTVVLRAFARTGLRANGLRLLSEDVVPVRPEIELEDIDGQPLVGDTLAADVRFTTPVADADLSLVRNDGTVVASPLLLPLDGERRFRAQLTVPSESSLLLELTGSTLAGNPFVRQITSPVLPQTVAIRAEPGVSLGPVGGSAPIDLTITNRSTTAGTFVFVVSTPLGWGVTFLTGPVTVEAGATVTLSPGILVNVPATAPLDARNEMLIRLQDINGGTRRNSSSFTVIAGLSNSAPECDAAAASVASLWPPNHDFAPIGIVGVTDPDGDEVSIAVTGITQDEAVDAPGSGNTAPDGRGVGSATAEVRAERAGGGNGRVYAISFTAEDGNGGSCSGAVSVGVPKSQGSGAAVDSGQSFDSTVNP